MTTYVYASVHVRGHKHKYKHLFYFIAASFQSRASQYIKRYFPSNINFRCFTRAEELVPCFVLEKFSVFPHFRTQFLPLRSRQYAIFLSVLIAYILYLMKVSSERLAATNMKLNYPCDQLVLFIIWMIQPSLNSKKCLIKNQGILTKENANQ